MTDELREEPLDGVEPSGEEQAEESVRPAGSWLNRILVAVAVLLVVAVGVVGYYVYQQATVPQAPQTFAEVRIGELQSRIHQNPKNTALYLQLAAAYYDIKEYDKALKALDDLRSTGASGTPLAESMYATAKIQETQGNEAAAVNGYERSLAVTDTADARFALGLIKLKHKDWNGAITHFKRYTVLNPNDVLGYKNLAAAYEGKGDRANALKQYERAVAYVPTDSDALAAIKRLKGQQ